MQLTKLALRYVVLGAVAVFILEVMARLILPHKIAIWREPGFGVGDIQFISQGAFQNANGYRIFTPNENVRIVSYYPDMAGELTREYDCTYRTDKNGFPSNDADYADREILVLGESFTVGLGGCEWISRLAPDVRSRVYGAAHMGLGPVMWEKMVAHLASVKRPQKILIIFITDDFFRPAWTYSNADQECVSGRSDCAGQWFYPISENMDDVAARRYAERYEKMDLKGYVKYYLPASYAFVKILKGQGLRTMDHLRASSAAISRLAGKYDVRLLWVNERREAAAPMDDTHVVEQELVALKVHLSRCHIPVEGFLPRDNHPSRSGYEALRSCVQEVIRGWEP